MWGNGWFVLPNPVYGTGVKGGPDDIFAKDVQWRDPGRSTRRPRRPPDQPGAAPAKSDALDPR
jgi:hypothetical protein